MKRPRPFDRGLDEAPGSDLLSHGLSHTTIGACAFHFRVRDGIGWDHAAVSAREAEEFAQRALRQTRIGTWDVSSRRCSHERRVLRNFVESQWPKNAPAFSAFPPSWRSLRLACQATWSYMIKPLGSLVSVSSALLRYTPDLSTT